LLSLDDAPRTTLSATFYRVVHTDIDPLSSRASERSGGRYNLPGIQGVLYASLEKTTAIVEVARGLRVRGIDPAEYGPDDWWAYELEWASRRVLDLTDDTVLERLQVNRAELVADDVIQARQIGRRALDSGYEAIMAPSAARGAGKNLIIFLGAAVQVPVVKSSSPVHLSQNDAS
jgi:RES domain-containing protein